MDSPMETKTPTPSRTPTPTGSKSPLQSQPQPEPEPKTEPKIKLEIEIESQSLSDPQRTMHSSKSGRPIRLTGFTVPGQTLVGNSPQDITIYPQQWVIDGTLHIPPSAGSPSQAYYQDIGLGTPSTAASGSPRTFEQRVASSPSQYLDIPPEGLPPLYPYTPVVPSSSSSESLSLDMDGSNSSSGGGNMSNTFSSIEARRQNVLSWMASTNLLPSQREVVLAVLSSSWWENEEPEPEVRPNDPLVLRRLIPVGGSRFRAFLDEENGYRCTFDHDGKPCTHGKGRTERALGTIRGFFKYKPVQCSGACGTRCQQRFVSVEQCQKHVQKKRSGRVACPECGSSILPANLSRHRRTYHAPGDNA